MVSLTRQKLLVSCFIASIAGLVVDVQGFTTPSARWSSALRMSSTNNDGEAPTTAKTASTYNTMLASMALVSALSLSPLALNAPAAYAYESSDYASDTVQTAVKSLKDAAGNEEQTFESFENIAEIIAEGKGVGGSVDYKGVTLDRGFIADEDTSIYNPGLTLLTEGEKERLVESLMDSRKAGIAQNHWSEKTQSAYAYLKYQLDPLHMTELAGYLKVAPIFLGVLYLGVVFVQQNLRDLFPAAYIGAVVAIAFPAAVLLFTSS